jgi:hypothetical protein
LLANGRRTDGIIEIGVEGTLEDEELEGWPRIPSKQKPQLLDSGRLALSCDPPMSHLMRSDPFDDLCFHHDWIR